jgi:hypothetical protein
MSSTAVANATSTKPVNAFGLLASVQTKFVYTLLQFKITVAPEGIPIKLVNSFFIGR